MHFGGGGGGGGVTGIEIILLQLPGRSASRGGGGRGEGREGELYPGLESFHRGRCYWLWWKTVPFADGAGEERLLPARGLASRSCFSSSFVPRSGLD